MKQVPKEMEEKKKFEKMASSRVACNSSRDILPSINHSPPSACDGSWLERFRKSDAGPVFRKCAQGRVRPAWDRFRH